MHSRGRHEEPLTALDGPAVAPPTPARVRHVLVNLSNLKHAPTAYPGLVVEWRRTSAGWEALVAHVTEGPAPHLHVSWCRADQLRPVPALGT